MVFKNQIIMRYTNIEKKYNFSRKEVIKSQSLKSKKRIKDHKIIRIIQQNDRSNSFPMSDCLINE